MQVVYARCAGLDVHKKTASACISVCEVNGVKHQQTRAFGTFTQDLLKLADWLKEHGVTHVAIAYASHCTSLGRGETFSNRALFDNLTPLAFFGGSGPGSS